MTTSSFLVFSQAVRDNIAQMTNSLTPLFQVTLTGDQLWEAYLSSFPAGSNPLFRKRTEHDCSCCRNFIRHAGGLVTIEDDNQQPEQGPSHARLKTIWDIPNLPEPYATVAAKMAALCRAANIQSLFLTPNAQIGTHHNWETPTEGSPIRWDHFSCKFPSQYVIPAPPTTQSLVNGTVTAIQRSLEELDPAAISLTLDLCEQNSLYRGRQYLPLLQEFSTAQRTYKALSPRQQHLFLWRNFDNPPLKLRTTAIGTLVADLTNGTPLDQAVRKFESMVAPQNYQRSSAPITSGMISKAIEKVRTLGLEPALARRYATAADVSVNNVIFASRSTRSVMRDALEDLLLPEVTHSQQSPNAPQECTINHLLEKVLPSSTKAEILVEPRHLGNLVSITAPTSPEAKPLFPWTNGFAWSYRGNLTDSIRERVRKAGGSVSGLGRVSLSWTNTDDLDIHVREPHGHHIYYANKHGRFGFLDVDMNVTNPTREPVENITWPERVENGTYTVWVNNFTRRESIDSGFTVEIEVGSQLHTLSIPQSPRHDEDQPVCHFEIHNNELKSLTPTPEMHAGENQVSAWNLTTNLYHEVRTVMLSPNFWDGSQVGNKHWFFLLEGCTNPEETRGFYSEFLRPELREHRKVFEILGDKIKCPESPNQLSGLGFSETIRNDLIIRVQDTSSTKVYKVKI